MTAIHPRGKDDAAPVFAGWHTLNGNGEMTGLLWLTESGFLYGPVMLTNTAGVGVVRDAVVEWGVPKGRGFDYTLPVVAETWDGTLSDLFGFHVTKAHAFEALNGARSGPVAEGSVGVGRMGGQGGNSSGDIFVAFSTANAGGHAPDGTARVTILANDRIDPIFEATIQATEEAILNAMLAAETMTGADGVRVHELPHGRLVDALRQYDRLERDGR